MNNKEIFKKLFALGTSTFLLAGVAVQAQGNRLVSSVGRYSVNTGNGTILIDTDDIEQNAKAIQALNGQLGGLSFKYGTEKDVGNGEDTTKGYYWSQDENGNWVKIGAVGNAKESDVLTGKKFSSEGGVDLDGTMPVPTYAEVSKRTNPTSNLSVGDTSVTLNNSEDTTEEHNDSVSHIDLGIGEQITIPHGYYNKDIVISNGVSNRGSASTVVLTSTTNEVFFASGYYDEFKVSTNIKNIDGVISYKHHIHSINSKDEYVLSENATLTTDGELDTYTSPVEGGCFTEPVYGTKKVRCGTWEVTSGSGDGKWNYRCSGCGAKKIDDGGGTHTKTVTDTNKILGYTRSCGYTRGEITEAIISYPPKH